jgi:hypothetical protein
MPMASRRKSVKAAADTRSYRSGVAARLAGVPVDTLRVWERRYGVVRPPKSPGRQRLYSRADIERLALIKALVEAGHAVGEVAGLGEETLRSMRALGGDPGATPAVPAAPDGRVALVGWLLATKPVLEGLGAGTLQIVGVCEDPYSAADSLAGSRADVLVVELPTVQDDDLGLITAIRSACRAEHAILLYRYARAAVLRRLRLAGLVVERAVPDAATVEAICRRVLHPAAAQRPRAEEPTDQPPPPPKFDQHTLARLAAASRTVDCECPKHLVDLVVNLGSFERYSAQCAARDPADRELHRELERAAGRARAIVEAALERVAVAEGFALPLPLPSPAAG